MEKIGFLFDLDGVIVDTAKYHFLAWKDLAEELGISFTPKDNERLKGVSRMASFEVILEIGNRQMKKRKPTAPGRTVCILTILINSALTRCCPVPGSS